MTDKITLHQGDCLETLRTMPDNSVDSIVCDPPAGIGFMGRDWDSNKGGRDAWIAWLSSIMKEGLRVLKPGGHALVWALPRTSHWTGMAVEDAGFELRDRISHLFGSGFPKSMCVSKAIDKAAGIEGTFGAPKSAAHAGWIECGRMRGDEGHEGYQRPWMADAEAVDKNARQYIGGTDAARQWQGWGTALKPAMEDWWLARKPLSEKTVAANVLQHGTGALNIDGCRVEYEDDCRLLKGGSYGGNRTGAAGTSVFGTGGNEVSYQGGVPEGRWPANLILSDDPEVLAGFPQAKGQQGALTGSEPSSKTANTFGEFAGRAPSEPRGDTGSAARFFKQVAHDDEDLATMQRFMYCAKASRKDRDEGLEGFEAKAAKSYEGGRIVSADHPETAMGGESNRANTHPTVKPTDLMRYLCRLVTPPGGVVLDPFMGSGSTGKAAMLEGFRFIGCELSAEYLEIARARIHAAIVTPVANDLFSALDDSSQEVA